MNDARRPSLLSALAGDPSDRPPIWFMRQASRSLPEDRALREQAPDFIAFCLNAEMAAEATLQPMRRFAFDAAIVFADILLIPMALGQAVWFETGEGPRLGRLPELSFLGDHLDEIALTLAPVAETLRLVRGALEPERALIGFARGAGALVEGYATGANVQGVGLDVQAPAAMGRRLQAKGLTIQGALDPLLLRAGGLSLDARVDRLLEQWGEGPYIFNLGHGVLPDTPIENIERVVRRVTGS